MITYKVLITLTAFIIISYGCPPSKEEECCAELNSVDFSDSNGFLNLCIIRSFDFESDVLSYLKEKVPGDNDLSEYIKEFVKEHFDIKSFHGLMKPKEFCQYRRNEELLYKWKAILPVFMYHDIKGKINYFSKNTN
ncbi:uncharacterized protein LOC113549606 [Rhopalosiphum maidis]|uniref:uncharacterized protein LOC113549606 n=1 Tax=Rhopalosiphum maidis TaxID=43146 RepID=UPI000F000FA2|nr:uncharacterized protein LOC113549606 [Rhopalosiphum maidis]